MPSDSPYPGAHDQVLSDLLDDALAPPPAPEGLSSRIVEATGGAMDPQFEAMLNHALAPEADPALAGRVMKAVSEALDQQLEADLDRALAPEPVSAAFQQRIVAAVTAAQSSTPAAAAAEVDRFASATSAPGPLARIGQRLFESWRIAAAAVIVFAYGAGLWLSLTPQPQPSVPAPQISFGQVEQRLRDLAEYARRDEPYDAVDQRIEVIALDLEGQLAEHAMDGLFTPEEIQLLGDDDLAMTLADPYDLF